MRASAWIASKKEKNSHLFDDNTHNHHYWVRPVYQIHPQ